MIFRVTCVIVPLIAGFFALCAFHAATEILLFYGVFVCQGAIWALWWFEMRPELAPFYHRVPDSKPVPGYVEGWRRWRLCETPEGVRLGSLWNDSVWPPRVRMAADRRLSCHGAGLYAYRRLDFAVRDATAFRGTGRRSLIGPQPQVFGRVALWGRVIECERGWQGEFGYPQALYMVGLRGDVRAALQRDYAIEIYAVTAKELCDLAARERAEVTRGRA